jgi:hypothetical protein
LLSLVSSLALSDVSTLLISTLILLSSPRPTNSLYVNYQSHLSCTPYLHAADSSSQHQVGLVVDSYSLWVL